MDGMAISPAVVEERQRQWLLMQQHQQAMLQHRLQQQQGQMSEEQFQAAMMAQQQLAHMHAWRRPPPGMQHPLAALSLSLGMGLGGHSPQQQTPRQQKGGPQMQFPPRQLQHEQQQRGGRHSQEEQQYREGQDMPRGQHMGQPSQRSDSRLPRSSLASASQRASSPQTVSYQSNLERPDFERERRYIMQQRQKQQQMQEQPPSQEEHRWGPPPSDSHLQQQSAQQGHSLQNQRASPALTSSGTRGGLSVRSHEEVQGGAMLRVRSQERLAVPRSRSHDSLEQARLMQQHHARPPSGRPSHVPRTLSPASTAPSSFGGGSAERGGPGSMPAPGVRRPSGNESSDEEGERMQRGRGEAAPSADALRQGLRRVTPERDGRPPSRPGSRSGLSGGGGARDLTLVRAVGGAEMGPGSLRPGSRGGDGTREGRARARSAEGGEQSGASGSSAGGRPMLVREWLNRPERMVDRVENLHLFRQVVLLLDAAHRQGTVVRGVRPSNLVLTAALKVSFRDAATSGGPPKVVSSATRSNTSGPLGSSHPSGPRPAPSGSSEGSLPNRRASEASPTVGTSAEGGARLEAAQAGGQAVGGVQSGAAAEAENQDPPPEAREAGGAPGPSAEKGKQKAAPPQRREMTPAEAAEATWYTSPEEMMGHAASPMSDMYSLGVLFFELFLPPSAPAERARVMADLRHRILPPWLLLEHSKEAAFMLWLLHPEPNARPRARDVLQSDLLGEATDALAERQAAIDLEEAEAETEVLAEFLQAMAAQKAAKVQQLRTDLQRLNHDISEVSRRRAAMIPEGGEMEKRWGGLEARGTKRKRAEGDAGGEEDDEDDDEEEGGGEALRSPQVARKEEARRSKRSRVMRNFEQLERVYFATRWSETHRGALAQGNEARRPGSTHSGSELRSGGEPSSGNRDPGSSLTGVLNPPPRKSEQRARGGGDWLGSFFDSLCKFARYSRFEVRATLRHGDLLNTANMVCSLGFDRDDEFFATAGVCKRIKVFECEAVLSEGVDIHYPVVEMVSRSKLSSICWNNYIKSHIASSDYEGIVQLWDASTSQVVMHYEEHEKRAWSVDFSKADPTRLASGGDDGCVKLWSISQEPSVATIKTKANVCCVQFCSESSHVLAFGSADYKVYAYDLRNIKAPLAVLAGHGKAVSYVKFVDANTIVSASTDNTLKLWDLNRGANPATAPSACTLSYTGHTNEKNFVGLSVSDGYIACGSENNAVFCYHKSLPMPMASHAFRGADPVTGQEIEDDAGQFVSSVCWREKSNMLVAANSMGNIKLLEMV